MAQNIESHSDVANGNGLKNGELKDTPPGAARSRGLTNGLGSGRTSGTGSSGMTNGMGGRSSGLTNGMGGTNGMTNGLDSGAGIQRRRLNNSGISPSRISLVLIIALIIMVPASFFLMAYDDPAQSGTRVDGNFDDWSDALIFNQGSTHDVASLNIIETSVETNDAGNLFMYAKAGSSWFSSQNADSLLVFIDSDDNPATGYAVRGMGAEYAVEVHGWESAIRGRQFGVFGGQDQHNWNAWNWRSVTAAMSASEIEIGIPGSAITLSQGHAILFMTKRGDSVADVCDAEISLGKPAIVVKQAPKDINGIITADNIMSLDITAQGASVDVTDIGFFSNSGTPTVTGLPATIAAGQTVTLQVNLPLSGVESGTFLDVSVSSVSSTGKATILGTGFTAYAKAAPNRIIIDGAFGDWNAVSKASDATDGVANSNVDITNYAAVKSSDNAYFYLKTDDAGKMMGGAIAPQERVRSAPSQPSQPSNTSQQPVPPAPLKRVSGEDVTRIYIDTQNGGESIGGISADYMIEIKGRNGQITSQKLYSLPLAFITNIDAAAGGNQLEAGVSLSSIGFTGTLQYFMESTDWKGGGDRTQATTLFTPALGTRAEILPVDLGIAGDFAVLAATAISNTGTSTTINGDVGLSPASGLYITGLTASQVNGTIYAVDDAGPTGSVKDPELLTAAHENLTAAYNDAEGREPTHTYPAIHDLGGETLTTGVYNDPSSFAITGTLTLDALGDPNAIFIFQAGSTLTTADSNSIVSLINGTQARNVFWQVGSSATIGTGSTFKGNILADVSITIKTGATMEGSALARTGAVTLDTNNIANSQSTLVINEVMFDDGANPDWFELYNPSAGAYDISGWQLINGTDSAVYTYPATTSLGAGEYSTIDIGSMLGSDDYLALVNANGTLMDFVAWGTSQPSGTYYQLAIDSFNWPTGEYVDTTDFVQGNTIGRDANSTDTNTVSDWEITCGVDATSPTPDAQNIPEFHEIAVPLSFLLIIPIFAISRRRRYHHG